MLRWKIYQKRNKKEGLCREIAQEVAKILSGTNDMPIELKWLPEHCKVKGSEGYCMKNYLSRSFLNNVVYADYFMGNINCTLFILIGDSEDETRGIFTKLNKIYQTKDKLDRKTGLSTLPYIFADELHAVCDGNRIVGVVGKCSSESKSTLIQRCLQDSSLSSVPKPQ